MNHAPIALFVYNRPSHTQRTIDALRSHQLAPESDLIVFSDAAKDEAARPKVAAVREVISAIDGFKSVRVVLRDRNWGLAASVIDGVTELCRDFGKVIVLEDDLIVAPGFLRYMNQALDIYQDQSAVMQISGHMFPVEMKHETDAFFLPFTTSWGWATWQRAWEAFDEQARGYTRLKTDAALKKRFDLDGAYPYFHMLEAQLHGKIDSWAIRWYLSVFLMDGLTLYPRQTLVSNAGFDGSGTHRANYNDDANRLFGGTIEVFPRNIQVDVAKKSSVYRYLGRESGYTLISKARMKLRKLCGAFTEKI